MATERQRGWRIVHSESEIGWGGQEHRILAELTGFQRRGCQVWLLAARHGQLYERATAAGIATRPLPVARIRYPLTILQTALWLRRNRVNVLNTHSSRDGWIVGLAGRLARVPLIVRTRHIDVKYPNRWLSVHAYRTLPQHVLTTSEKITAHFREFFRLPAEQVSTVPTGIDLNLFSPEGPRAILSPDQGTRPCIGMVSVLRSWKGHRTFIEAARLLRESGLAARFIIVGEGDLRGSIENWIRERQLEDCVTLTGHREDVPAVLRALSILVIPSTDHEGIPQIGLQALAVKTPVVGSDVGGTPEIIRHGETGRIFPAGKAEALAVAIRETLAHPDQTRAACERGRVRVETHHSLDNMLDKLDALYCRYLPQAR